jgi:hypothetical protein
MPFSSTKVFNIEKSVACLAISVAKMHPIILFLKTLFSSSFNYSKKLASSLLKIAKDSAT